MEWGELGGRAYMRAVELAHERQQDMQRRREFEAMQELRVAEANIRAQEFAQQQAENARAEEAMTTFRGNFDRLAKQRAFAESGRSMGPPMSEMPGYQPPTAPYPEQVEQLIPGLIAGQPARQATPNMINWMRYNKDDQNNAAYLRAMNQQGSLQNRADLTKQQIREQNVRIESANPALVGDEERYWLGQYNEGAITWEQYNQKKVEKARKAANKKEADKLKKRGWPGFDWAWPDLTDEEAEALRAQNELKRLQPSQPTPVSTGATYRYQNGQFLNLR
jgi:hypothetical protein